MAVVVENFLDLAFLKPASSSNMFPKHYCSLVLLGKFSIYFNVLYVFVYAYYNFLVSMGLKLPYKFYIWVLIVFSTAGIGCNSIPTGFILKSANEIV